ncbi:DNA ligase D [Gluconacetobacter diazotrophicus]|uniref:DNA ligase (ATP) n=1 Tax=Gluconacetobacter diazotrophicus TaxID=33996 RepID=A0A7W4I7F1_GLUDI|nr:DNA ligase D [Gluconacetobacter diazotrophicus]MBB2157656.1 DNA ligase D [Gluconacetobacter diazotrophicus]
MALDTYRNKRDFEATPEPEGAEAAEKPDTGAGHLFVIQKHAARRLHYDLRLEMDGVLKSWAVTRGPSLNPGDKRLAVQVEDHPLDYGTFEGTIPKGQYGGGTVMLWDKGTWTPLHDPVRGLAKGHLDFELRGEKLHGRWNLVRMDGHREGTHENWLLIKAADSDARSKNDADILEERPESVKTGRAMDDIAAGAPGKDKVGKAAAQKAVTKKAAIPKDAPQADAAATGAAPCAGAKPGPLPSFVEPELATLVRAAPTGPQWLHEVKFDGYRLLARIEAGRVVLLTRTGLDWTARFGDQISAALASLPVRAALIDGELVVETAGGTSDFSALQADLSAGRTDRFIFYVFDLLHLDGYDLRDATLEARKGALHDLVPDDAARLRFSGHFDEAGGQVLRHACRLGLEGIVSKQRDAPYRSGRGRDWVKSKCVARQEFVIGGYVPSTANRGAVGSLVLGVQENGRLVHVGRVGTGFTAATAADLFRRLQPLDVPDSPFAAALTARERKGVRYVRPDCVAEVEFRAWTADGHLRHAAFLGQREDKPAADIVREVEAPDPVSSGPSSKPVKPVSPEPAPARPARTLTHPDRSYRPDAGVTKQDLADYYAAIWPRMAPFITDRALALLRCPNGIAGPRFFQKNLWKGAGGHLVPLQDPEGEAGTPLIGLHDRDGLIDLVQAAALEIHPWGASVQAWSQPDMIVMDLDPGDGVPWSMVIEAAREIRARLERSGLASFVKTTGGKGLHVVAPLKPGADWAVVKAFTRSMAQAMVSDSPQRYVATITKSRRQGRILVDYLRNQRGATAVAPYSPRARPGAPVAMPLAWNELGPDIGPAHFTIGTIGARLAVADPWAEIRDAARPLR